MSPRQTSRVRAMTAILAAAGVALSSVPTVADVIVDQSHVKPFATHLLKLQMRSVDGVLGLRRDCVHMVPQEQLLPWHLPAPERTWH